MDGAGVIAPRRSSSPAPAPSDLGDDAAPGLPARRRMLAIACLLAALALVVLSAALTTVALPALASRLAVTPAASVRIITAYQLALVMALLPCAALGESLGYTRVFTAGVALFTGASLACAFAPSLHWLLGARFLQGLGGAAVMALNVALLRFVVPRRRLAAAIGWNALTVALSSAAGPALGALLLASASLPWLFAIQGPLGLAVLVATRALPAVEGTGRALDTRSMALHGAALASLVVALELLPSAPARALLLLATAGLTGAELVRRELPKEAPLLPLDLLRERSFLLSVIASVSCFTGQAAALVALPFYLQHALGCDALTTGLMMTPWPLSVAIAAPLAGRLAERMSGAWLCAAGALCLALGLAGAALHAARGGALSLVPFVALCGAGFGLFQVPNNRNMLLAAPRARSGAAGGMQGTARLLGQTLGAVATSLLFSLTSRVQAPRAALVMAAALALLAGTVSVLRGAPTASEDGVASPSFGMSRLSRLRAWLKEERAWKPTKPSQP